MRWAVPLVVSLLLAGCSGGGDAPAAASEAASQTSVRPLNETQAQLAFGAPESERTLAQDLTIAPGETCFPFGDGLPCTSLRSVDLTPLIPVDTPVQLALSVDDDAGFGAFVDWTLQIEGATLSNYEESEDDDSGQDVFVLVMQSGGSVGVEVVQFSTAVPPAETHVRIEATAVVRPTVVPSYLPVAVEIGAGETLLAAGDGLEDLVVVTPSGQAIHHLGPFSYNATAGGRHIVMAAGQGDLKLFGKPGTVLRALTQEVVVGEPHPVTNGQDIAWEFTVPGMPLFLGVLVETQDNAGFFGVGNLQSNYDITVEHLGAVVLEASETDCQLVVNCGFNPLGGNSRPHVSEYLQESTGPGAYQVSAHFELSNNLQLREFYSYVV